MSNEEFVTMATEDPEFRRLVTDAGNGFLNDSNIFTKLWNALLDFLGLNSLSQINKDYVTNEIFQFINTIDDSLNANIEKSKLNEGFQNNEKLRKVEEVLDEIENFNNPINTEISELEYMNKLNDILKPLIFNIQKSGLKSSIAAKNLYE